MPIRLFALLVMLPLLFCGCSAYSKYGRGEDCERTIKDYSKAVRWLELEKAALTMVDKEQREAYVQAADQIRRRGVTMVDFRILGQHCRPEQGTADAIMEFDYFVMPDNRLKTASDRQKWVYREEPTDDQVPGWKLISPPPSFQ